MSMIGHFKQITPYQLESLENDPALVKKFISSNEGAYIWDDSEDHLNIDNQWDVINFILTSDVVLTNDAQKYEPFLSSVIFGGIDIGVDLGYGPARYLEPSEVEQVSSALSLFTEENFKSNFYSPKISKQDLYGFSEQSEEEFEYFLDGFKKICLFYKSCVAKGNAMLIYLT